MISIINPSTYFLPTPQVTSRPVHSFSSSRPKTLIHSFKHSFKMLFKPLTLLAVALGVTATPFERPSVSDKAIYAYGKNINGLAIVRVKDGAYLANLTTVATNTFQNVTFSCISPSNTLTASSKAQNGSTEVSTNLFGFNKETRLAEFTQADDAAAVTSGYLFFGNMLFLDMDHKMAAKWVARPVEVDGQSLFEVGWNLTDAGAVPIQLNTKAPMNS
ncbi:hypothetical protein PG990_014024 [Apiospora arundinis]|uniref:Uncharacterized protein n=1 Tax=Apiospora arundinis TaxID=335852 RepID=A0ABR2I987_9PEZI